MKSILLFMSFVLAYSCTNNVVDNDMTPQEKEKIKSEIKIELQPTTENTTTFDSVTGIAADGVSSLVLSITKPTDYYLTYIAITPKGEDWGSFSKRGKELGKPQLIDEMPMTYDNEYNYNFFTSETTPTGLESDSVAVLTYQIDIKIGEEQFSFDKSIEVVRPPVMFVHGMASSASTYDPILSYIRPSNLYITPALYSVDYQKTSLSSYSVNDEVIKNGLDYIHSTMAERGYITSKVGVVGHSMGGILARIYIQSEDYRDDILKLITIDTPHSGSQFADWAVRFSNANPTGAVAKITNLGAIVDLQVDSEATVDMNCEEKLNKVIVPTHIIGATIGTLPNIADMVADKQYVEALILFAINDILETNIYNEASDLVVPISSQQGGVKSRFRTQYNDQWHCSVLTSQQTAIDLLDILKAQSSDESTYTTSGFEPEELVYDGDIGIVAQESSVNDIEPYHNVLTVGFDKNDMIVDMKYSSEGEISTLTNPNIVETMFMAKADNSNILLYGTVE